MLQVASIKTGEEILLHLVESMVRGRSDYVVNILSALSSVEKDVIRVFLQSPESVNELTKLFRKADLPVSFLPLFRAALTVTKDAQKDEGGETVSERRKRAFERILTTPDVENTPLSVGALDRLVGTNCN